MWLQSDQRLGIGEIAGAKHSRRYAEMTLHLADEYFAPTTLLGNRQVSIGNLMDHLILIAPPILLVEINFKLSTGAS